MFPAPFPPKDEGRRHSPDPHKALFTRRLSRPQVFIVVYGFLSPFLLLKCRQILLALVLQSGADVADAEMLLGPSVLISKALMIEGKSCEVRRYVNSVFFFPEESAVLCANGRIVRFGFGDPDTIVPEILE